MFSKQRFLNLFKDVVMLPMFLNLSMMILAGLLFSYFQFEIEGKEVVIKEFLDKSEEWQNFLFIGSIVFFTPIFEEFVFRKLLWGAASKFFSQRVVFHLIAIVFALSHLDLYSIVGLMPFSYYLSHLRVKYDGIKASFFAHVVFNVVGIYVLLN